MATSMPNYSKKAVAIAPERWATFKMTLPIGVYSDLKAAETKIVRVLGLDPSEPGKRARNQIEAWKAIALLILLTDESRLKLEIEGDES